MEGIKKEIKDWLKTRPKKIQQMAEKWPPYNIYRLTTTGQHCYLHSYSEDGTVSIIVNGHDSEVLNMMNQHMPCNVFGINPEELEVFVEN